MITLRELKDLLNELPVELDNLVVILQKDAEGNDYSPLSGMDDNCTYTPDSTWSGEVHIYELTPELMKSGYAEEDAKRWDNSVRALVLFPIN